MDSRNITDPSAAVPYGGQAVVEGVMMRGSSSMCVAARTPDGEIVAWSESIAQSSIGSRVADIPVLRGIALLGGTLTLGVRALMFSAAASARIEPKGKGAKAAPRQLSRPALWATVGGSVLTSVGIFFVLPLLAVTLLDQFIVSALASNVVEGLIRLILLFAYLSLIGRIPDVQRLFGYHGAEHKVIHAWESGQPLDVEHIRPQPLEHPRCGTGFLLVVVMLSMVVFFFLGRPDLPIRMVSRLVLVPLIAGVAYELLKHATKRSQSRFWRLALEPSLRLQRLTTREPDDAMIEVAAVALRRVLEADGRVVMGNYGVNAVDVDEHAGVRRPAIVPELATF